MYEFLDWQVRDVMSEPVTIGPEVTIREVASLLEATGFNAIPVVDEDRRLLGVVGSLDVLRAFHSEDESTLPEYSRVMERPVSSIVYRDVVTTNPRTPLTRALEKLVVSRNKSIPVLDGEQVVGVVAREDLMEALRRAEAGESLD